MMLFLFGLGARVWLWVSSRSIDGIIILWSRDRIMYNRFVALGNQIDW